MVACAYVRMPKTSMPTTAASIPTPEDTNANFNAEFWYRAKLYKDWKLVAQIEPNIDLETGKFNGDHDVPVNKLYAEGTFVQQY